MTAEPTIESDTSGAQPKVFKAAISTTRSTTVGDRQKTAQRLLRSTADRSYDGELDIDWDADLVPGSTWVPDHRITLYGSELWDDLTEEQKYTLGMHEAVAVLSYGIFAEVMLSVNLLRSVFAGRDLVDDHVRYALAEIAEETRHSTMFGRLINKTGVTPYPRPKAATKMIRLIGLIPPGPSMYAGTLLIEEVLDRLQREGMMHPDLQPHFRQLMKIHILEEARHITYAREELVRSVQSTGRAANAYHRVVFALMLNGLFPMLVHPGVYRSVGIAPLRGVIAARRSPDYAAKIQYMAGPLLDFLYDAGMIKGFLTTRLIKRAQAMSPELAEKIDAARVSARR